ncbi:MAG: hypothetical protein AABY22_10365 [Nanoarchaeota archaeon]
MKLTKKQIRNIRILLTNLGGLIVVWYVFIDFNYLLLYEFAWLFGFLIVGGGFDEDFINRYKYKNR